MSDSCCTPEGPSCCKGTELDHPHTRQFNDCCLSSDPEPCCDGPVREKTGLPPSTIGTVTTAAGPVPRVTSRFTGRDRLGIWKVRWGLGRMDYTVPPGLYALGDPDARSEVLVTANYRMTFDLLRRAAGDLNAWILVLNTMGVNVWCAAGKGNFGTGELSDRIVSSRLSQVVEHRRLIVPQLGAVGISAHEVKQKTGFEVIYGPVEASDIRVFLEAGRRATSAMRRKDFPLSERAALVPMEVIPALKWAALAVVLMALVGGLAGPGQFLEDAARLGLESTVLLVMALISGSVLVPVLLPWIPGRAFSVKGAVTGMAAAALIPVWTQSASLKGASWTLFIIAVSSFLAMNFTGSSTYTSLSGVKREMNMALPAQLVALIAGFMFWIGTVFFGGGVA